MRSRPAGGRRHARQEFSARRRQNTYGRHLHLHLRCREPDALALLEGRLAEVVEWLEVTEHVYVRLSPDALDVSRKWAEGAHVPYRVGELAASVKVRIAVSAAAASRKSPVSAVTVIEASSVLDE